jgi:hypothetical protein
MFTLSKGKEIGKNKNKNSTTPKSYNFFFV